MNFSGQCERFLSLAEAKHYNCGKYHYKGFGESAQRNKTKRKEEKKTETNLEACPIH